MLAEERRTDLPGLPAGGWLSAFDGYNTDDPSELDINHIFPTRRGVAIGASAWDGARRVSLTTSTLPAR